MDSMDRIECTKFDSVYLANQSDTEPKLINDVFGGSSNDLRKSNIFCDAIIQLDDGNGIPIHRIILSTACDYF